MADDEVIYHTTVRTVLGSSRREQRWDLAHEVAISTVLGKSFFDLRNARPMGDEDVEITINCVLGSIELLVPVGTRVTLEGSTFLAGASSDISGEDDVRSTPPEGVDLFPRPLPRLDISANAVLGRVRVRTPDRPKRARTSRREHKSAQVASGRSVPEILAEYPPLTRQPFPMPSTAPSTPVPDALVGPRGGGSAPNGEAVGAAAEDTASASVTFVRSEPEPEPVPSLDDFDPADFPDDSSLVS